LGGWQECVDCLKGAKFYDSWPELDRGESTDPLGSIFLVDQPPWVIDIVSILKNQSQIFSLTYCPFADCYKVERLDRYAKVASRRWSALNKASGKSAVIGIVIHSTQTIFSTLAMRLNALLIQQGLPSHIICISALTPMKLGNFTEISAFVILGCPLRLFTPFEFHRPLISCFELLCLLNL
jgi:diphthamide biosynthesis enzyme Dph1/Dph2-like protein